jgi:meso-butanediol dehydrogenase / (S,S)-butanediol dehydrogenase / diacetyl reductase
VTHLAAAAAEGDRSENAEYIYRKKQLRELDRRIRYLQKRLPQLKVIDPQPADPEQVFFGARVELENDAGELSAIASSARTSSTRSATGSVSIPPWPAPCCDGVWTTRSVEAFGSVTELDPGEWRQVLEVNVGGVMHSARAAIPALVGRGGGAIVIVASEAAITAGPHYAAYNTSKTALLGLARSLAYDYGGDGIRTNSVCPGWVRTEMSERETAAMAAEKGITPAEQEAALTRFMPIRRMGQPAEIAACIGFLASPAASFVNGAVLTADGGATVVDVGTLGFLAD